MLHLSKNMVLFESRNSEGLKIVLQILTLLIIN